MAAIVSAVSGFVVMLESYYNISFFVSCVDISVSLDSLFQRIASVYDRLYLSLLNKLCEGFQVFSQFFRGGSGGKETPAFLKRAFTA